GSHRRRDAIGPSQSALEQRARLVPAAAHVEEPVQTSRDLARLGRSTVLETSGKRSADVLQIGLEASKPERLLWPNQLVSSRFDQTGEVRRVRASERRRFAAPRELLDSKPVDQGQHGEARLGGGWIAGKGTRSGQSK